MLTRSSLPGNPEDRQARYIEAAVNGVLITSLYLPNGNPQPGPKFNYKLAWFERLIHHAAKLIDDTGSRIGTDTIRLAGQGHTSFTLTANYTATTGKVEKAYQRKKDDPDIAAHLGLAYLREQQADKALVQIGDPTLADGILDRLVHNAHRVEMRGDSMRKNPGKPTAVGVAALAMLLGARVVYTL